MVLMHAAGGGGGGGGGLVQRGVMLTGLFQDGPCALSPPSLLHFITSALPAYN